MYHVNSQPETFKTNREAVTYAITIAPSIEYHQCLIWDRPFHAVATVRHYPETGDTLVHRYDRYGREQPGTPS